MNSASTLYCPNCSSAVTVADLPVNLLACSHCQSVIEKKEDRLVIATKATLLQKTEETIQPGTRGIWKEQAFEVLGRCRFYFAESAFNYWTIRMADNSLAWLAEGYGLFFIVPGITAPQERLFLYETLVKKETGRTISDSNSNTYLLEQKQACDACELEGQAFFPLAPSGFTLFEMSNTYGRCLMAVGNASGDLYVYQVFPAERGALQLAGLKEYAVAPEKFGCQSCNTEIAVKNYPYAQSCFCPSCGLSYSLTNKNLFEAAGKRFDQADAKKINVLGIGNTGILDGTRYFVHGFAEKQEKNIYKSKWREYYLFSPEKGYRILSEYDGHWVLLHESAETPVLLDPQTESFTYQTRLFRKYNRYSYSLNKAEGEFPHNILDNDETLCYEYICPPYIWITEQDPLDGIRWFSGKHISSKELLKAFNPQLPLPYRKGTGAVAPTSTDGINNGSLFLAALVAFILILILHFSISATKDNKVLLNETYHFKDSSDITTIVVPGWELDKGSSNLAFTIVAPVENSWFSLSASLVNSVTGKEYNFEQGVEYYSGTAEGEYWSEGSRVENYYLTGIPAGRYVLQMQGLREKQYINPVNEFTVEVKYDVPDEHNFWWSIVLLLVWPVAVFFIGKVNTEMRWSNSPFHTSITDNDDDE